MADFYFDTLSEGATEVDTDSTTGYTVVEGAKAKHTSLRVGSASPVEVGEDTYTVFTGTVLASALESTNNRIFIGDIVNGSEVDSITVLASGVHTPTTAQAKLEVLFSDDTHEQIGATTALAASSGTMSVLSAHDSLSDSGKLYLDIMTAGTNSFTGSEVTLTISIHMKQP